MLSHLPTTPALLVGGPVAATVQVQQKTIFACAFLTKRRTRNSQGFEWQIRGDAHRKTKVEVGYRAGHRSFTGPCG